MINQNSCKYRKTENKQNTVQSTYLRYKEKSPMSVIESLILNQDILNTYQSLS